MPAPNHEFGDTCPVLNVAKKHGVSYEQALYFAHYYTFGEVLPNSTEIMSSLTPEKLSDLGDDIASVALRMQALKSGQETFP